MRTALLQSFLQAGAQGRSDEETKAWGVSEEGKDESAHSRKAAQCRWSYTMPFISSGAVLSFLWQTVVWDTVSP